MKIIRPLVICIAPAVFSVMLYGKTSADIDGDSVGQIVSVDSVKKEVLVKKDDPQREIKSSVRLYTRIDGQTVVLEVTNPMYTQLKCRAVRQSDFALLKKDMRLYIYSEGAGKEYAGLGDAELANKEKYLLIAAQAGSVEKVRSLIHAGADINATTGESAPDLFTGYSAQESWYFTPLHLAAVWNRADVVELLLNSGADYTTGEYTPYSYALSCNNLDCARVFIRYNADTGAGGITPLVRAVILDDRAAVKKLVTDGADVNERSYVDRTALMFASTSETAEILINAGADPNLIDMFNSSALWNMANSGYVEPAKFILVKFSGSGLDMENHGSYGDTPLMRAAMMGHIGMARLLLSYGANINAVNNYGTTALILAAAEGHVDMIRFLVSNGADINAKNDNGDTALIQAAYNGSAENVKILLDAGADPGIAAGDGKTAADLAEERGYTEIAVMIRSRMKKGE